jgi:small-conductance mechanosensitive channel
MEPNYISIGKLVRELLTPTGLNEVLVVLVAVAIAYVCGRLMRRATERMRAANGGISTGWQWRLMEAGAIVAPYVIAVLLIGAAREAAEALGVSDVVLVFALRLVAALGAVRLGVYAVRLLLGDGSWLAHHETRVTLLVWLTLGLEVLGGFDWLERVLGQVDLLPGKSMFSLWDLMKGLVVVTAFVLAMTLLARAIERRVMAMESLAPSTRVGISKSAYFLLIGLGVLLGINSAGVDLTALTVLTGAIVFGLGFGIRDITSNFVSGFVLLMDKSIKPGDVISFHQHTGTTSDNFGWVQELRGRYVVVRDRDGVESLVPNQSLITNSVINWSYSDQRVRLRLPVMVSYDDDPEVALDLLVRATDERRQQCALRCEPPHLAAVQGRRHQDPGGPAGGARPRTGRGRRAAAAPRWSRRWPCARVGSRYQTATSRSASCAPAVPAARTSTRSPRRCSCVSTWREPRSCRTRPSSACAPSPAAA